jgi:hypothetical protein
MSVLAELRERVEKTNALIAQCENTMAAAGVAPPPSALATVRSLEKLRRRLEAEYLDVATRLELEVYRYRILNESDRVTLSGIAEAWSKFQAFFESVYTALTKSQKQRTKKPPQSQERLELGYGYSFASSVGVVVTVPRDVGIYASSPIQEASSTVFDLIEAKNASHIAEILGPSPILAFHDWIGVHVENQYGLGLEWRSEGTTKRTVEVQYQSLLKLQETIADTTTTMGLDVKGELFAVNTDTKEFKLRADDGHEYQGRFGSAITAEHAASVPARYGARITQTTKIIVLGKEPQTTFFLDRLDSL